tara:strand:- start:7829 stop:8605 length:777 start_codon:yes stop_codon:yes gene_type:complete
LKHLFKQIRNTLRRRINIRKEFLQQTRLRNNYEKKFKKQLRDFFKNFHEEYAELYINNVPTSKLILDQQNILFQLFAQHYSTVIRAFGSRMLEMLQKNEEQFEIIYQEYLRENGGTKIVGIVETTRRKIIEIIEKNLEENEGQTVIANQIRKYANSSYTRYRANTIARTETHNAASFANQRIAESQAIPNLKKRWSTTPDERSRDIHVAVNGQEVGLDEDFTVGGMPMKYPGDPRGGAKNVINCRCVVLYITDDDEVS